MTEHFQIEDFDSVVSPFLGGGSFEFYLQNKYGLNIVANDKFCPLHTFWITCKNRNNELCSELYKHATTTTKEQFLEARDNIMDETDELKKAVSYFIINRCSFSGATLSGGFSLESAEKRFTKSSVDRVGQLDLSAFSMYNEDFEEFINEHHQQKSLMFLDPPYYLEKKSKLYGKNGDMHEHFDHQKLFESLSGTTNWFMTYNDCEFIRELYKDFTIIEAEWSYGMANVKSKKVNEKKSQKKSSEIVILSSH